MSTEERGEFTTTNPDLLGLDSSDQNQRTFCERFKKFRQLITVEPVAFLAFFSSNFMSVATQTLFLQKACRVNLNLGDEICDALQAQNQSDDFSSYERMVQEYYASHIVWVTVLQTLLPSILLIFIGGWSDKTGHRKVILLLPTLGSALNALSVIVNVIFFNQMPLQVLLFFNVFFVYVTGGLSVLLLGLLNYIFHITTAENRTHRLGFVSLCFFAGIISGLSLSGIIFRLYGYYAIYITAFIADITNILYIIYRLVDPPRSVEEKMYDKQGFVQFLKTFFDLTTIRDIIAVICKKTADNRMSRLCVLLFAVTILYGPAYGESSVVYMATRYRFNWDEVRLTIFLTYSQIATALGTIFAIVVFSKILKWHDSIMGITSGVGSIISGLLFCFAPNDQIFFIGPALNLFNAVALLATRSLYSKFLEKNEIGKFNSLVGLIENLSPLIYVPMFTRLYTNTMDSFPGAIHLLGVGMVAPAILIFIWLLYKHKEDMRREKTDPTIDSTHFK